MRYRLHRGNLLWLPAVGAVLFVLSIVQNGFALELLWIFPLIVGGLALLLELGWRRTGWVSFFESHVTIRMRAWGHEKYAALTPNVEVPYEGILAAWITPDNQLEIQVDRDCGPYGLTNGTGFIKFRPEDPYTVLQEIQSRVAGVGKTSAG